ncbi:family A G protein-coupled receptor-like protein [Neoconidiobolus thromboides FSU 785]|nr:family A G protein-coupled receptor-like protein [Neoconidiobolus thromboides FSU 785]
MNNSTLSTQVSSEPPQIVVIIRTYVLFTEGVLSVLLNLFVLGIILYRRSLLFNVSGIAVLALTLLDAANAGTTLYGNIRFFMKIFGNGPYDCHIRGASTGFFTFSAIWMVALLAYSRYDAIISAKTGKMKTTLFWVLVGGIPMAIVFAFCVSVGAQLKFFKMPIGRCMLVDALHKEPLVMTAQIVSLIFRILTLVVVTYCYIYIATAHKKAIKRMITTSNSQGSENKSVGYHQEINEVEVRRIKRKVYLKISVMLFFYYLCLLPTIAYEIYELSAWEVRSIEADAITAALLMFLGVMNPLMVLVLHEQIKLAMIEMFQNLCYKIFRS